MKKFLRYFYYPIYLILVNLALFFYSNADFDLFCELKYIVNTNLPMYLLVSSLITFGNYYFFHRYIFDYFECKSEICIRIGKKRFTSLIFKSFLLFSFLYLTGNCLIDVVLFSKSNLSLMVIDYIVMLMTQSLLFLYFKKYDWAYVITCILSIVVKYILVTFLGM